MKSFFACIAVITLLFASCSKSDIANTATGQNANDQPLGSSAHDLLADSKYSSIKLEILYMPGYAPDPGALNNLVAFLNAIINKPGGIDISQRLIAASGKATLTIDEVTEIEKSNRTIFNSGTSLGVCLLFVDANSSETNVLGTAYKNTSMVIFGKKVHDSSGGLNQSSRTKLESTVEEHEFGHLLGLVNLGSAMVVNHEDADHSKHCNNKACLMYYQTQVNVMGGILVNSPVAALDANCKNDLKANGGK